MTHERILAIRILMKKTMKTAKGQTARPRLFQGADRNNLRQPYTKVQFLVNTGIVKRQTASQYLYELERISLLKAKRWVGKFCI